MHSPIEACRGGGGKLSEKRMGSFVVRVGVEDKLQQGNGFFGAARLAAAGGDVEDSTGMGAVEGHRLLKSRRWRRGSR